MPFTFSHPAIVLPLTLLPRQWFSLTGLVIGTLTPDFEYFIRMRVQSNYSHTIYGLLWFDLPLGVLLAFIFHNIVRDCLFNNLPMILKSRILKFTELDWNTYFKKKWFIVLVSILFGAVSHLFWDSFTHDHGYFVRTIPQLTNTVVLFGRQIPIFKILQHSSTLFGGILIIFVVFKLPAVKNVNGQISTKYWLIFTTSTLAIISIRLLIGLDYKLCGHLIVTAISACLVSSIITPILTGRRT
jgi:hypothetical protein